MSVFDFFRSIRLQLGCSLTFSLLAACSASSSGLKPQSPHPPALVKSKNSESGTWLIDQMYRGKRHQLKQIRSAMDRPLRRHASQRTLRRISKRFHKDFGPPVEILEESQHQEGVLLWTTLLVVHRKPEWGSTSPRYIRSLVLYQFAENRNHQLEHLVIRQHPLPEETKFPSKNYLPVNRFRLPSRGKWYVLQGGWTEKANKHYKSRTQRYGYDLIVKQNGVSNSERNKKKRRNHHYYGYGQPLFAPAAGVVKRAVDGVKENIPGTRGSKGGNGVVIDHGFGERSELWHMIPGTVQVKTGQRVKAGQYLGKVGNSGHSTLPHIHFHVVFTGSKEKNFGIPVYFLDSQVTEKPREDADKSLFSKPSSKKIHRAFPTKEQTIERLPYPIRPKSDDRFLFEY